MRSSTVANYARVGTYLRGVSREAKDDSSSSCLRSLSRRSASFAFLSAYVQATAMCQRRQNERITPASEGGSHQAANDTASYGPWRTSSYLFLRQLREALGFLGGFLRCSCRFHGGSHGQMVLRQQADLAEEVEVESEVGVETQMRKGSLHAR